MSNCPCVCVYVCVCVCPRAHKHVSVCWLCVISVLMPMCMRECSLGLTVVGPGGGLLWVKVLTAGPRLTWDVLEGAEAGGGGEHKTPAPRHGEDSWEESKSSSVLVSCKLAGEGGHASTNQPSGVPDVLASSSASAPSTSSGSTDFVRAASSSRLRTCCRPTRPTFDLRAWSAWRSDSEDANAGADVENRRLKKHQI